MLHKTDVVLKIGRRVADYLRKVGYDVLLSQIDELERICDTCNDWHADLFVSIHCNAANGNAQGTETYHFYGSAVGRKLATTIYNQIVKSLPIVNCDVKQAGFLQAAFTKKSRK